MPELMLILNGSGKVKGTYGYSVSIAISAKTSDDLPWLQEYDFGGIGSVVDFLLWRMTGMCHLLNLAL